MSTILFWDQDGAFVISRRTRTRDRVLAHLRAWRLDTALANGACPDSTATLSLRANELISCRTRRRMARSICRMLRRARRPHHPIHQGAPICWHKVMRARPLLEEIADALLGPGPVEAQGVAQVQLLLTDGASPVFSHPHADDLQAALEAALDALHPGERSRVPDGR
jgi:hypothetical protein